MAYRIDHGVCFDRHHGYDINLMVAACDYLGDNQYLPALPIAMYLDAPGVDAAGAARRVRADLAAHLHQPNYLAGDGLYANATAETFHLPARALGWKLVLPILNDHLGEQGSADGLVLVEGGWYCARNKGINDSGTQRWGCRAPGTNPAVLCAVKDLHKKKNPDGTLVNPPRKFIGGPVLGTRLRDRITPDDENVETALDEGAA